MPASVRGAGYSRALFSGEPKRCVTVHNAESVVLGRLTPGSHHPLLQNQVKDTPMRASGDETRQRASLKARSIGAARWTVVAHLANLLLRFFGTIILTRIFEPAAFGILAVVTAIQVMTALLTDIGLRQAVVQSRNGASARFLNTA